MSAAQTKEEKREEQKGRSRQGPLDEMERALFDKPYREMREEEWRACVLLTKEWLGFGGDQRLLLGIDVYTVNDFTLDKPVLGEVVAKSYGEAVEFAVEKFGKSGYTREQLSVQYSRRLGKAAG